MLFEIGQYCQPTRPLLLNRMFLFRVKCFPNYHTTIDRHKLN